MQNEENPSQKLVDELASRGIYQDSDNPNRFVNHRGTVEGYASGNYFNNGTCNEKID